MRLTRTEKQAMADQVADPVAQICPLSCLKPDKPWQVTCSCFLSHWELIRFCCAPGSGEMNLITGVGGGTWRGGRTKDCRGTAVSAGYLKGLGEGWSDLVFSRERRWINLEQNPRG